MDLYGGTKTKFDVPLNHLDFAYVKACQDKKELEKILKILRCVEVTSSFKFALCAVIVFVYCLSINITFCVNVL